MFNQNKWFKTKKCLSEAIDVASVTDSFTDRREDSYVSLLKRSQTYVNQTYINILQLHDGTADNED